MSVLVGRHGLSKANDRNSRGTLLFGHPDAPLMDEGRTQSREMGVAFKDKHGVDPARTRVAVSRMMRAQQTATQAGFLDLVAYEALNEVDTGLDYPDLRKSIDEKRCTDVALRAAELILADPPEERVWITHGLVIASLCEVIGIADRFDRFVPRFCEIRELPI